MTLSFLSLFLFLLMLKHTICDLAIQRLFPADKNIYLDKNAHIHYFHHAVGSFLVGLMLDVRFAIVISTIDYVFHWHIDHAKTKIRKHFNWTEKDNEYWVLQSFDQSLHFATYYLFAVLAIQFYI
jgi:hypothetical protein